MLKKSVLMVITLCSLLAVNVFAQYESRSYIFSNSFEEDTVGAIPNGWRSVNPLTEQVQVGVTADEDKVSPFTDIFPAGSKSLLFIDEDSTKSEPGAAIKKNSIILVKDIKSNPNADFFLSLDFKILRGGNMSLFLFGPNNQYLTRIRAIENRPLEIRAADNQYDKPNFILKRGQWYRLQLTINRAEGTMDITLQTEDGTVQTFEGSKLLNPMQGKAIEKVWFQSTVGDGAETGSWVIDNVFAQELR